MCRDEVAAFQQTANALAMAPAQHRAPHGMKRRVMRAVREFLMVTWVIQKAAESAPAAAEAAKRIAALRTGASRKDWRPY